MTPAAARAEAPVHDFEWEAFASGRPEGEPRWLRDRRARAIARFRETGLPSVRDEDWRQTPIGAIARTAFARPHGPADLPAAARARLTFDDAFAGRQVVLVNGRFSPALSSLSAHAGLRVESLAAVAAAEPGRLERALGSAIGRDGNPFAVLNDAFLEDGTVITVAPGTVVAEPIHVLHYATPSGGPAVSHPRLLVLAGRASQSTIVESFGGADGVPYLTNAVSEVVLEDGAIVDHYTVQRESGGAFHVATVAATQGRDARFASTAIAVGAALARLDVVQAFAGEGGECQLGGLILAADAQVIDIHTRVDHAVPRCSSRQLYKAIVDGRARGVFVGRVRVAKDAQKTDAQQTNKNLLLSRQALVHSVPQLEILADDVKCKHGSTTGQIDPAALFYLRSRGIGEDAARSLLTFAFASDVVGRIKVEPLRAGLGRYLRDRLPSAADIEEAVV